MCPFCGGSTFRFRPDGLETCARCGTHLDLDPMQNEGGEDARDTWRPVMRTPVPSTIPSPPPGPQSDAFEAVPSVRYALRKRA